MSKTPVLGAGTNFTRTNGQGNGYIASFITDAGDPSLLNIPGGNWNLEFYFQSSSTGGSPQFYAELYKVSSANVFTLIASGSTNPEGITNGTTVDEYYTSIPVPQTSLLVTDRLAVRIYVITSGRTITLHTENSNLCEILTTFSTGLNALNGLTAQVQYFATGTSGTDFGISSATDTHTFNLPTASSINRGALSSADWTTFSGKVGGSGASGQVAYWNGTSAQSGSNNLFWDNANGRLGVGNNAPTGTLTLGTRPAASLQTTGLVSGAFEGNSNGAGFVVASSSVAAHRPVYSGIRARGTLASPSAVFANDLILTFLASAHDGTTTQAAAGLNFFAEANATSGNAPIGISFITGSSGAGRTDKMQVRSNGNVLIQSGGTFTDGGQRLQVQGTTLLNGNVTFSSATGMFWDAANARLGIGTNTPEEIFTIQATSPVLRIRENNSTSTNTPTVRILNSANNQSNIYLHQSNYTSVNRAKAGQLNISNNGAGGIVLAATSTDTNATIDFVTQSFTSAFASILCARITNGGNFLLGSASDTGERLQVTGNVKIVGSNTSPGTNALTVQNSAGSLAFYVTNGLTTFVNGDLGLGNTVIYWSSATQLRNISNGVLRFTNSSANDFTRLQFGGGTTSYPALQRSGSAICVTDATGTFVSNLLVGTTTDVASSKLTIDSTTQGFLPPRMTTTQKNAITSPAAGLVVYDTTLNKLCVYTTAWETITSI
jgi:hypothetical protein